MALIPPILCGWIGACFYLWSLIKLNELETVNGSTRFSRGWQLGMLGVVEPGGLG